MAVKNDLRDIKNKKQEVENNTSVSLSVDNPGEDTH